MWILFVVLVLILAGIFIYLRAAGKGSFPWIQFYTKGKESGFNFHEINLIRRVAVETKLENPAALFWSIKQLDRSIKEIILKIRAKDLEDDADSNELLQKLFELRKRVEFDLPRYKLGLKSTREIAARQRVKVTMPGTGPFLAMVIENRHRYFALSSPKGGKLPDGFTWKARQIGIHFWRAEDAGYFVKTKVIEDYRDQKYPIIHVAHSDGLARVQKRRSVRVTMNQAATVFPLDSIHSANEVVEQSRGLKCRVRDLSEDGAAIMVGGRTKAGMPLKLQVDLPDRPVVICGVVRGVNYDNSKNVSLLHIQSVPPSASTKNRILTYVYNLFGEQEQDKTGR
ncbi:MAG TPA: PilZ domain-containing protein [bacterium]|nr:PilZ domain-containing protein [bacterium]